MSNLVKGILNKWLGDDTTVVPRPPRRPVPEPGDVVRMALPTPDNPNRPGTHLRHGIVVNARTAPNGNLTLQVIPADPLYIGRLARQHASTFSMPDEKSARAAGLPHTASFDLSKAVIVDWSPKYAAAVGERPLVGQLQDKDYDRFLVAYRAHRIVEREQANRDRMAREKPAALQQVKYTSEIVKAIRNKGQEREMWA